MTTTDIATQNAVFSDDELHDITDWNSGLSLLERSGMAGENFSDYGTGFKVVDKDNLKGVPLMILEWRFNNGDFGEFVSATAVAKDGRKVIINDGSTGIAAQLRRVTDTRVKNNHPNPQAALLVENGLTRSDYTYTDPKTQEQKAAVTYYLSE